MSASPLRCWTLSSCRALDPVPDPGSKKLLHAFLPAPWSLGPPPTPRIEISSEEALKRKVKGAIKEAEEKTLNFNLNLGTSQMMNKDSISRNKKGEHDYDINDAEDVIDDILSCSKFEFL
jgi:hypothetical protein